MEYNVSRAIKKYLDEEAKKVLATLVNPFGTFEKAKYCMYYFKDSGKEYKRLYTFITTIHSEEDCIDIMKKLFEQRVRGLKYFTVYKKNKDMKKLIYSSSQKIKP